MMSKRVYVDFARMIRTQRHKAILLTPTESEHESIVTETRNKQIDNFINELCDLFANDNSSFNRAKFRQACEIDTVSK